MIANLDGGMEAEKKAVSVDKIRNVAHAYAWWAAKGCVGLGILKVRYLGFLCLLSGTHTQ